jgi:hypothetical protein
VTCEELIEELSFPVYRRAATMICVAADFHRASSVEMVTIDPLDLKEAQDRDVEIPEASSATVQFVRDGTNDFTCMPGHGDTHPAMCADKPSMQWFKDFADHRSKRSTTVPGITYMLTGATQRSDSDPYDRTSPLIPIGPHWMIMWPFDPKATGLPTTHRNTGAYVMWAGTPYAHVHVMGAPEGTASAIVHEDK